MTNYTTNLNLEKPEKTEQYSIDVFNRNADKIDNFAGLTPPRAVTADKLTTGIHINDVYFDGTEDIKIETGGGLEIGDIGIAPLGIDESKGKRRYLNGQLIMQSQYVGFTNKLKSAIALYPSLATTESNWQATVTISALGQCGKFVVDDEQGTIRLPKIIMPIQGLTSLSNLAEIVEAGLPTLTTETNGAHTHSITASWRYGTYSDAADKKVAWAAGDSYVSGTTNATSSSNGAHTHTIEGTADTVQQEQIQYPYFIQVATGAETEDNIINEIELNNPFSLLDYKYSEYELNNASWLLSQGQYNAKAIYPDVYDLLLKIYNGTETKAGVSVKLSTDGFTDYDFVLNTLDETFRLPIKVKLASGKAIAGNGQPLGVTNGTNTYSLAGGLTSNTADRVFLGTGAYDGSVIGQSSSLLSPGNDITLGLSTDSTRTGVETSDSDLYLYFYVGETVQNANLINTGRALEKIVDIQHQMKNKITNCILAMYGITYSGNTFTVKAGTKALISNGFNADRTFNNIEWVAQADIVQDVDLYDDATYLIYRPDTNLLVHSNFLGNFAEAPDVGGSWGSYYNTTENRYYMNGETVWYATEVVILAELTATDGVITTFKPKDTIKFDGEWIKKEIDIVAGESMSTSYSLNFDLSEYLPNDSNVYEVLFRCYGKTAGVSGASFNPTINGNLGKVLFGKVMSFSTNEVYLDNTTFCLVDGKHTITVDNTIGSFGTATEVTLRAIAYRRVK